MQVRIGSRTIKLPRNRLARMALGFGLILGGMLWFLPVVGLWMLPLGFIVLATDLPPLRRFNRRVTVAVAGWWKRRRSKRNGSAADPAQADPKQRLEPNR